MSSRSSKRTKRGLKQRIADFEALKNKQGQHRPGSLNRRRSGGRAARRK